MLSELEKQSAPWEHAAHLNERHDSHGSDALSTSSGSSQSDVSSTFTTQNCDSPVTSLSSRSTSPSLSQSSGKVRRSSELSGADDDLHEPLTGPALKKCKLDISNARVPSCDPVPKPDRGCSALRISRALFVENLVDAAVSTIASIWGRFSKESRNASRDSASNSTLPLDLFVREILRRSRTSCSTLQAALLYCIRCKDAVEANIDRMADAADALSPAADTHTEPSRLPSLSSPSSLAEAVQGTPSAPSSLYTMSPLLCGRRMFLAAIVVASKFLQDRTYSNRTWSKISGLAPREIEQLERVFLHTIQYNLVVDASHWTRWTQELSSNWGRAKRALATPGPIAQLRVEQAEARAPSVDARLHRAISENVLGQALPFDAGVYASMRTRSTQTMRAVRPSAT